MIWRVDRLETSLGETRCFDQIRRSQTEKVPFLSHLGSKSSQLATLQTNWTLQLSSSSLVPPNHLKNEKKKRFTTCFAQRPPFEAPVFLRKPTDEDPIRAQRNGSLQGSVVMVPIYAPHLGTIRQGKAKAKPKRKGRMESDPEGIHFLKSQTS